MGNFILAYFFVLNVEDDGCSLNHVSWTWPQWHHCSMGSWPSLLLCWRKSIFCFYRVGNMHGDLTDEHHIIKKQLEKHLFSAIMVLHWQKRTLSSPQWAACLTGRRGHWEVGALSCNPRFFPGAYCHFLHHFYWLGKKSVEQVPALGHIYASYLQYKF